MSDKIDDPVARIASLEDLEAIRHTWRDYCLRLDSADWIALAGGMAPPPSVTKARAPHPFQTGIR